VFIDTAFFILKKDIGQGETNEKGKTIIDYIYDFSFSISWMPVSG
jgi:hypothetical protein